MKTYYYIVRGRVQGVAFRYYTIKAATQYQISGTVKNLFNGDVEVYAQGADEDIKNFEAFLHRGPISARVDNVVKNEFMSDRKFHGFDIIY